MAGLLANHRPGPAKSDIGGESNEWANATITLTSFVLLFVLVMPVALVGMLIVYAVWKITRPTWLTIVVLSLGCAAALVVEANMVAWLWPWGLLIPNRLFGVLPSVSALPVGSVVERSCAIELQAGPLLLLMVEALLAVREKTIHAGVFAQAREGESGIAATLKDRLRHYASIVSPQSPSSVTSTHPPGGIRLGVDKDNRRKAFDLTVADLRLHTFLPGATGSGKTTTLERIADGAMANGYGLVIIDCKGGSLGATARKLASLHSVPFIPIISDDPDTVGYNPTTGSPSDVANKLIGSFTFGETGEIYKQVGMHVIPLIVKGLIATGVPVTLVTIADSLDANGLRILAKKVDDLVPDSEDANSDPNREVLRTLADQLRNFVGDADVAGKNGVSGLKYRLGALVQGSFGPLFAVAKELDWDAVFAKPTVAYVSFPVAAASEDVELLGRVIIQDLKQACGRRLRAGSDSLASTLIAIDEFAALKDAKQIIDLLLQARQAKLPLVLSTQLLPQDPELRSAVLQAGLLIAHRLQAADAEEIAAQFGTRSTWKVTHQIDWETAETAKGTIRDVDEYVVHPNTLRQLPQGTAAVRSVPTARWGIVEVLQTT